MIRWRGKLWIKLLAIFFAVYCVVLITVIFKYETILYKFEDFLIVVEPPKSADVIIVLSGGNMAQRVDYGVKLYKLDYGKKILMSGGPILWNITAAEIMKQHAMYLGVPADAILMEKESTTTYENAQYSLDIMLDQDFKSAMVVTSPYHTRRTRIIFEKYFNGKGVDLTICAFPYKQLKHKKWWQDEVMMQFITNEYLKLVWHYLLAK